MDPNQPMTPSSPVQNGAPRPVSPSAPVGVAQPMRPSMPVQNIQPQQNPIPQQTAGGMSQQMGGGIPQQAAGGMPQQVAGSAQVHHPNNANDLYAQITAADEEIVVTEKKKTAPLISFMAVFMRITFWLDELQHAHERFFIFLHTLWACVMGILYLAGSVTLFLSIFSFMQLPIYLEKYFSERGIQYDSLEMSDYSFSEVEVINLRDKNNTYNIPKITIRSTFADFLQNRIRTVEASDLNVDIAVDGSGQMADFDLIIKLLQAFSEPKKTGLELDVNFIRLNNAVLNIKAKDRVIPVSFTLSGDYTKDNVLVVTFSVNEDFLKMSATMTITGSEDNRKVEIKINDKTGFLTLPQRPTEQLQGNVSIEMQNHKVQKIGLEAHLNYAYSLKTIRLNLQNNGQDAFNGSLLFAMGDSSDGTHTSALSTDMTLNFQDLIFSNNRLVTTDKPLQVSLRRLAHKSAIIEGLNATLHGNLSCQIDQGSCAYTLKQNALLQMANFQFDVKGKSVRFAQNPSFTVLPSKKENIRLQLQSPYLQMEAPFEDVKLAGIAGEKSEELLLNAKKVNLQMTLAQKPTDTHLQIVVQNANYLTSDLSMNRLNMKINDYFDETGEIRLDAYSVQTGLDLLKKPISLEITNVGTQTVLQAQVVDTNLSLSAQGTFDPFKLSFAGRFMIPMFDLDELPFNLSELSSVFPKNISNTKGQIAASGQLKVNGISSIAGPLFVGLKDVSFNWDDTTISGINGVLGFQSLEPLVTGNNQKLFIQNVQSFIPISNLLIQFYINNQSLRLANVSGQIANQDVMMSSALISLKNPNTALSLRTAENFNLSKLDAYFNLPNILLKEGDASFNIPVNITENGVNLGEFTIKMFDGTWRKEEGKTALINLFNPNDTAYTVRSAQLILNAKQQLQIAVDGWRLPTKEKNSFGPETIELSEPLLRQGILKDTPSDIQKIQSKLGM